MSSTTTNTKPEQTQTVEKNGKHTISIIGCGQIGVLHACLFLETGFKVTCADPDQTMINLLIKGKTSFLERETEAKLKNYAKTGLLNITNDIGKAASSSDVILVAIPVEIDEKKKADYSEMEKICKQIGANLHRDTLVMIASVTGIGITEGLIKEALENTSGLKAGADFGLAYSPVTAASNPRLETLMSGERTVSAIDKNSLDAASTILEAITKARIKKTVKVTTAEAAALFKMAQHDVNIALANELALFCEKTGVDYLEVRRLAQDNNQHQLSLPALENENLRKGSYLLLEDAENLNMKLRIPATSREINEEAIKQTIRLIKDALRNCGKTVRRARISLLGASQTPNTKSPPTQTAKELAKMLEAKGAKVNLYDPYCTSNEPTDTQYQFKKNLTEAVEGADCIVILTGHDQFKHLNLKRLKAMMKMPAAIIDLENTIAPEKVEKEGLVYRGPGRGAWIK